MLGVVGRSLMKIGNRMGSSMDPCRRTPLVTDTVSELKLSTTTHCIQLVKNNVIHLSVCLSMSILWSLYIVDEMTV